MDTTRASLLLRVRDRGDSLAWGEFDTLYRPLLKRYASARGLGADDAEDVAQHCLLTVARKIREFEYDPTRGRFRAWLRKLVNDHVSSVFRRRREQAARTGDFERPQEREPLPDEEWERIWLEEHLKYCMNLVRKQVAPQTFEAFYRVAIEDWPVERTCQELGMTANQVYVAKSRMTRRLQALMRDLAGGDE
jgi:RNA polymerase sigma-70 factor (ECF subfamily)